MKYTVIDSMRTEEHYTSIIIATVQAFRTALETRSNVILCDGNTGEVLAQFDYYFNQMTLKDCVCVNYF